MSTRQLSEQVTKLTEDYEKRVDPVQLTHNETDPKANASTGVDYEPYPERSLKVSAERQAVVDSICRLYSGSASDPAQGERDCHVYAEAAMYVVFGLDALSESNCIIQMSAPQQL